MKIFLKFRSFEVLEVGFLSKNFSIGEFRLIAIVAKEDPTTWIFKMFGVELYYDETNGISSINHGLLHFVHIEPP